MNNDNIIDGTYAVQVVTDNSRFDNLDRRRRNSYYKAIVSDDRITYMRVSNHHTMLYRWVQHREHLDISYNLAIVFSDNLREPTIANTSVNSDTMTPSNGPFEDNFMFNIHCFMYDVSLLTLPDLLTISRTLNNITNGTQDEFVDPLRINETKRAKQFLMRPNEMPILLENEKSFKSLNEYRRYATAARIASSDIKDYIAEMLYD